MEFRNMNTSNKRKSRSVTTERHAHTTSVTSLKPAKPSLLAGLDLTDVLEGSSPKSDSGGSPLFTTQLDSGFSSDSATGDSPSAWNVSNMVIDEENDENILTAQRMQSFVGAFPKREVFSKSVIQHLDSLRRDSRQGTFRYDFASAPSSREHSLNSAAAITTRDTMKMMKRPSALPAMAQSGTLQWRNINIFVGDKSDGKQILFDFSGEIESGQLLAVMGGSGAGKSTFLDALSGRSNLNQLTVEGELAVNGYKFKVTKQELIRSLCTFVPQSDVLCPTQTVEEALRFYARLKLPHLDREKQEKRVQYLIDVLHLKSCRRTIIGDERKRGVSGGEKRRVSIAAELLNDADIIFLDEPTSGLDAYTAARTIKTLKQFCLISNKMVIATIHQPSVEVFYLFDQLILLGAGRPCFAAPINAVDEYFADKISPTQNPADVIIYEAQREPTHYAERWANDHELNPLAHPNAKQENASKWRSFGKLDAKLIENGKVGMNHNDGSARWFLQFWRLIGREVMALYRDYQLSVTRIFQVLFLAVFIGLLFFDLPLRSINNKSIFIMMSALTVLMFALVTTVTVFPAKKLLFQRESRSGNYGVSSWALSFQMIEIPREAIFMALYTVIVVMLTGAMGPVWLFLLIHLLADFAGGSLGIFCGAIAKDLKEAALILPVPLVLMIFFSDSVVPLSDFPTLVHPLAQINPMYLLIRILMVAEWGDFEGWYNPNNYNEQCQMIDNHAALQATEERLAERTAGMNCSEMINELTFGTTTSTAEPTMDPNQDIFCQTNITNSMIFNTVNVDPDLFSQWLIQLATVSVIIRVLAVIILYVINKEGVSWIKKRMFKCLCCCCLCFRRKKNAENKMLENLIDAHDETELGVIEEGDDENGVHGTNSKHGIPADNGGDVEMGVIPASRESTSQKFRE